MGMLIISLASLFLVYVNSSDILLAWRVFINNMRDKVVWGINGSIVVLLLVAIYVPRLNNLMKFTALSGGEFWFCVAMAAFWYDIVKLWRRRV